MGKDKKKNPDGVKHKGKKDETMYQCSNCNGVSDNKKDVCKPEKVDKKDLSKKQLSRKPCKYR